MIDIIINNNKYSFEKNITVLQACEFANIIVPRFCYHEKLSIAGSCRMCLVEIEKSPKPVASCAMPISKGMVIFTDTPLVKKAQESVLELLLINHPLDCPICDQGGECDLQDITLNFGSDRSRFFEVKRVVEDKECGPIIKTIMTRCIHCTRCIRFLSELAGTDYLGSIGRGDSMEIGTYLNKYIKTELSGNLVDICPVGALTSKPFSFKARNWELKKIETIDFSDSLCSNIIVQTRNESDFIKKYSKNVNQILRILPKKNDSINETWISDKTRFAFDGSNNLRINSLILNNNVIKKNISWKHYLFNVNNDLHLLLKKNAFFIGTIGSILSVEECFFFSHFLKYYGINNFLINNILYNLNTDLPSFYEFNSSLKNIEKSDLIILIGINPRIESSMLNLKLRKHFFNKEVSINLIGSFIDLTYPVNHLGNSIKTLLEIIEGKNSFCKLLRKSKNPLVIVGSEFTSRIDSLTIQNLLRFLSKKSFLLFKNYSYDLNFVHLNVSQSNFCQLGLNSNAKSITYLWNKNLIKNSNKNNINIIANNIDNNYFQKNLNYFLSLNTHHFNKEFLFKKITPINNFFERNGLYINTEVVVQQSFQSMTSLNLSRNSEDIFRGLQYFNNNLNILEKKNNILKKKYLQLKAPFLKYNNFRKKFYFNFLNIKENTQKLFISNFKPCINNFYMTDNISKNSKMMAECSLFLDKENNFIKIN